MSLIGNILRSGASDDSAVNSLSTILTELLDKKQPFDSSLIELTDIPELLMFHDAAVRFRAFQLLAPMKQAGMPVWVYLRDVPCFSGVSSRVIEEMLAVAPVVVRFPVIFNRGDGKIAKALVFRWEVPEFRCVPLCPKPLPISGVLGGKFALIVFDREFYGASFQLAVSVAVRWGTGTGNLAFTGGLAADGTILPVQYENEKRRLCSKFNLPMLGPSDVRNLDELGALCFDRVVDVPFLVHISSRQMAGSFSALCDGVELPFLFEGLPHLMSVDDAVFFYDYDGQLPDEKKEWYRCLDEVQKKISMLIDRLRPRKIHLHLALRAPAAFALMLGAALRGKKLHRLTVYQYDGGSYVPVLGDVVRGKEPVNVVFSSRQLVEKSRGRGQVIGIRMGQDSIEEELRGIAGKDDRAVSLIECAELAGSVPAGNWTGIVTDVVRWILQEGGDAFDLVFNVPVAVAVGLGRELGYHKNIRVFHLGRTGYFEVGNLKDIRDFAL